VGPIGSLCIRKTRRLKQQENEMKSMMKNIGLTRMAIAAAVLVSLSGGAALASVDYAFKVAGQPSGNTLTVQVVDPATGQSVTDVRLFAVHVEYRGAKSVPSIVYHYIPLTSDGHGGYIYEGRDVQAGTTLKVVARIGNSDSFTWGSVRVPG
jgi:hypothetical protein